MRLPPLSSVKSSASAGLVTLGIAWAALAVLDPALPSGRAWGPVLAVAGLVASRWSGHRPRLLAPACGLTLMFAIAAFAQPEDLRADSPSYYAYLRSAAFDHDLDFANEWREWGFAESPVTATGRRYNQHTVGPALLWNLVAPGGFASSYSCTSWVMSCTARRVSFLTLAMTSSTSSSHSP